MEEIGSTLQKTGKTPFTIKEYLIILPNSSEASFMTAEQVYDFFDKRGEAPEGYWKFGMSDAYGHETLLRTKESINEQLDYHPKGTVFKATYHPTGITLTPQTKTQAEIKRFQNAVANF